MADITSTESIQSFSLVNIGYRQEFNESIWSNSFLKCDGNYRSIAKAGMDLISYSKAISVNLFYIPDIEKTFIYDWLKVDKTVIDVTINGLEQTLIESIIEQLDNTDINVRVMWLNKYEFLILFTIHCDYISDVNLVADWQTDNPFILEYLVKKIPLTQTSIAFKFYHRFKS